MRYIIIDEAGTSANEPLTIVLALIVHADKQVMFAEGAINEVLGSVPPAYRDGFIFHATDVFSSREYREGWSQTARFGLLKNMMSLPRRLGIPIAFGLVRRDSPGFIGNGTLVTKAESDHIIAFYDCVAHADRYMRLHAELNEVGTVIAEDAPKMRRFLKKAPRTLRDNPRFPGPDDIVWTQEDVDRGYSTQNGEVRVTRIRNSVLFAEKSEEPLLQMADACAFGLRRYFSEMSHGEEFGRAVLRDLPNLEDFRGPASGGFYC